MQADWFLVDAFTQEPFSGNPAAVVLLDEWLDDTVMAGMAAEHNQAETAFVVPEDDGFGLRWFTPTVEVQLCGHATLASGYVLLTERSVSGPIRFSTRWAGVLMVDGADGMIWMDFPAYASEPAEPPTALVNAIDQPVQEWRLGPNHLVVLADQNAVSSAVPDLAAIARSSRDDDRGVIITAPGSGDFDFVSRFFAPGHGIDEDAVTGSAHCMLAPYWSSVMGRDDLVGRQLSARSGTVACRVRGDRVHIGGHARLYGKGHVYV